MNRLLSATLATIIISGCGGSGGGTPTERLLPPPPSASGVSITGTATKGPLDSSDLEFLPIDAFGDVSGSAVVTAVTAADGSFSAIIPQGSGALLVRSSGGSYIDEADREPNPALKRRITLGAGEGLESLLPPGTTSVTISIATQALLDKTRRESTGDTFLQHFAANRALAEAAFGFDIVSTAPANPVSPDPGLAEAQRQYAMVLGGLANLVSRVSIDAGFPDPTIETILAVVRDFSDGEVDGLEDGTVVMVAGAPMGVYSLNEEITRFRNNNFDSYSSTPLIAVDESVFSQPGIPINTTPMAVGDSYSLDVGATLTIDAPGVLLNDTDADGDALTAVALVGPANATAFSLAPDGSFTYTHNGSSLDPDSFSYTAGDGVNDSNAAIVTLTFTNTAPVASDDADTVLEGGTLNGASVLDNDTDAEGNSLVAILVTGPVNAADFFLDSDGTFFYAHDGGETAQDQFSYIANDGVDDSAPANVVINITPVNDPPIAQDDNINVDQGATQTILTDGAISVLNNDSDAEGDALTAALVIPPTSGQLTLNPDGTFVYSHDGSQTATDQFTYMVSDGIANSNVVPVFITVNPPGNTPPVAIDDSLSVAQGGIQSVLNSGLDSVLDNDFDNDQDPLAATLVDPPNNGQLTLFADGRFEYQHDGSQTQGDQFTYVANDGTDDSNIATVDVCVVGTNSGLINSYDFNGDLSDTLANGVDLVASGGAVDVGRYFFEPNQGLRLTQALPCVTDYAVEIRFQVNDEVLEFNKLIDFQELASDPGVYIFEGGINFFPQPDVAGLLALDTDFTVGIARAAGQVEVYLDGNLLFSFADVENVAVPLQNVLNFFVDDFGTLQGESFAGSVDFIRIHNDASTFGTQPNGNNPPTGIILDNTSVDEGQPIDTIVGTLSTIDPDCCDAHIITFVPGPGSDDNALFRLTSSAGVFSLRTAAVFDAAQTPTLSIRLQTDDQDNQGDGTFQQAFTITVNPSGGGNSPPIALDIDNFTVVEGQPTGTTVGNFTTTDPDTGDTHIYSLVAGAGDTDNALFDIAGATLITAAVLDFQQGQIRSIRVRTDDQNGGTLDQIFIIVVEPAGNVPPTAINLDNLTVLEGEPAGTPVGTLTSADANLGDVHLYTLVAGAGGEDNAFFSIVGDELQTATTLDAAQTPTLSVRIRTDDQNGGTFEEFFPIIVLSQLSDNANLASLTLLNVTLVPPFDPSTLNYTATVPFTVSSTQVSPTSESAGATITFNGFPVASGSVSTLGLAEGDNAITIGVTSEDGLTTNIYTVTITRQSAAAFAQSAYIKASNTGASDRFGFSDNFTPTALSADGNTLAVGASEEGSAATGINGNQGDDSASVAGAVYVFTRVGGVWSQQAYIKASNTDAQDRFGESLALSGDGDTLAVGASREDSAATGINGDQGDNSVGFAGAVYAFTRVGGAWSQQAYIKASNTGASDSFGRAVALSSDGSTLAVGAPLENSAATGINGDQGDNSAVFAGAVYAFTRVGGVWSQQAYIKASNTDTDDHFGEHVTLSGDGDTLAVGAPTEDSVATGINGDQGDNSASSAGAVYAFTRVGGAWSQQAYIKASNTDPSDGFGASVALSGDGDTLAVGATQEGSAATGINGDQSDNNATHAGAVYAFTRVGGAWSQQAYIKASNTGALDGFGILTLSGDGNTLAVGARGEDSAATGVNGDQGDNSVSFAGAVYAFTRVGGAWSQQSYIKASNTDVFDAFGESLALSFDGGTLASGSGDDSAATGINGDQADNSADLAGAVYVFEIPPDPADADLGTLTLSDVALDQAFEMDQFNYTATVPFTTDSTMITPTAVNGSATIMINGMMVASGQSITVALAEGTNIITITVTSEDGSTSQTYTITITRESGALFAQSAYIKASNPDFGDNFAYRTAISTDGNTLAVSTIQEDSAATGVNGDQSDNSAAFAGAVYVFTRDGSGIWSQQAYLKASNIDAQDAFGYRLAMSADGNTLAVASRIESSAATGINGDESDNSAFAAGAAYVFVRDGSSWFQQAYIKASNTGPGDTFARSIALSSDGNTMAVGASGEDSAAAGINGDQNDNSATNSGAAYVYIRSGVVWTQQSYIKVSNTEARDNFGMSVSLSGDGNTLAVAASGEDSAATGVNGDQFENNAADSGAIYVFNRDGVDWGQQAYLKASNTEAGDLLGQFSTMTMSADGNTLAAGSRFEDSAATGIDGNGSDNSATDSGAVYVYTRDLGGVWMPPTYIKASNTDAGDGFGQRLSLSPDGTRLLVGALNESSAAQVIDGDQFDNTAVSAGAAYLYTQAAGSWSQQAYLKSSNAEEFDRFGFSVAMAADSFVVGTRSEDGGVAGINGDQASNNGFESGAVFVYGINDEPLPGNDPPLALNLSSQSVLQAQSPGANVGTLITADPDATDQQTYTLVAGTGGDDNAFFQIAGDQLQTATVLDALQTPLLRVRIRSDDGNGGILEQAFQISVFAPNNAPTDILLDNQSVPEFGQQAPFANITTVDPDVNDAHVYTLVPGPGDENNDLFFIFDFVQLGAVGGLDASQTPTLNVRLRADDTRGGVIEKAFVITVVGTNSAPTALFIDNFAVTEGQPIGTTVGNFTTNDPDTGDTHIYSLVPGVGDTDNALFSISGDTLITAAVLDFQQSQIRSIRVRTDDQNGGTLEAIFTIVVEPAGNFPPTAIFLDNLIVLEGQPSGTLVGTLTTADANLGDTHIYSLVAGAGGEDNVFFSIVGDELQTATSFDAVQTPTLNVRIRTDDQNGGTFDEVFTIIVNTVANTRTWINPQNGDWSDPNNWSPFGVPQPGDDVVIDLVGAAPVVTLSNFTALVRSINCSESIIIGAASSLIVQAPSTLSGATTMQAGSLFADGSATELMITGPFTMNEGAVQALNGALLSIATTSLQASQESFTWVADGAGSRFELPNLTTAQVAGASGNLRWIIQASTGGVINFPALTTLSVLDDGDPAGSDIDVFVFAPGSRVQMPLLSSFVDADAPSFEDETSSLFAIAGGVIEVPLLTAPQQVSVTLDALSSIDIAQITSLTNSVLSVFSGTAAFPSLETLTGSIVRVGNSGFASVDLSAVTSMDNAGVEVFFGSTVSLPGVTSYLLDNPVFDDSGFWIAFDTGSRLEFPNLTSVQVAGDGNGPEMFIDVFSGGVIDLPLLVSLTVFDDGGPLGSAIEMSATGAGSLIDMPVLATFTDNDLDRPSLISQFSGGVVNFPGTAVLTNVSVFGGNTAPIAAADNYFVVQSGTLTAGMQMLHRNVDVMGRLTGASGVNVEGLSFDVTFTNGTCFGLFQACDELVDFQFLSESSAIAASQALMDQVFLDVAEGMFDTDPFLTIGCDGSGISCNTLVPYEAIPANANVLAAWAFNSSSEAIDQVQGNVLRGVNVDSTGEARTWALWSPSALGVLANDTDVENDPLTAELIDDVTGGTLSLAPDGSFTYTHGGVVVEDTFTYRAFDGTSHSSVVTVTISIL